MTATRELSDFDGVSCVGGFYRWAGFEDDLLFMASDNCWFEVNSFWVCANTYDFRVADEAIWGVCLVFG